MSIDLRPFCANKYEVRTGLHKPWRDGAWVYATNGHMVVRVPANIQDAPLRDSVTQPKNPPDMFSKFLDGMEGEFLLMPPLPDDVVCTFCDGGGAADDGDECPECFGTKHAFTYFSLGDSGYNLHYLHLLSALPQVRIRAQGTKTAAALIFDGGQALLMPMRAVRSA